MYELNLLCPEARVDVLSEALDALDALSVSVEDADAETEHEQALFGEPGMPPPKDGWQRSRVVALFAQEAAAIKYDDAMLGPHHGAAAAGRLAAAQLPGAVPAA